MIITGAIIAVPFIFIVLLGIILILVPQKNALAHVRLTQRILKPGCKIYTTTGVHGLVLSSTSTHVVIITHDGQKQEFLKYLVITHEASV